MIARVRNTANIAISSFNYLLVKQAMCHVFLDFLEEGRKLWADGIRNRPCVTRQEACSIPSHATHQSKCSTTSPDCKVAPAPFRAWPHNLAPGSETGEVCFVKLPQLGLIADADSPTSLEQLLRGLEEENSRLKRLVTDQNRFDGGYAPP